MATYTSVQSGNFENAATWGGGGWPNLAGDTFIVATGHTVTVTQVHTHELGASTINGILEFSPNTNTGLRFGNATLTVGATGRLRIGTLSTPINQAYTATIEWNTTSNNTQGLTVNSGGIVEIYGDPEFYGSNDVTYLYANWTSGQTIQVEGDFSTKWKIGQEIYIHKGTAYSNYLTDVFKATIATTPTWDGVKTTITIVEAFPSGTFFAGGIVVNVSRNVKIGKVGAITTIGNYNTNRPRIIDYNSHLVNNVNISNAMFTGFATLQSGTAGSKIKYINCTVRNGDVVFSSGSYNGRFEGGSILSIDTAFRGSQLYCSARIFAVRFVTSTNVQYSTFEGDIYATEYGLWGSRLLVTGNLFANGRAVSGGVGSVFTGSFGWCRGVAMNNSYDFYNDSRYNAPYDANLLKNVKLPSNGLSQIQNVTQGKLLSEHHYQVKDAHYKYDAFADVIKNTSVLRSGGASSSIEVVPLSRCSLDNPVSIFGTWVEDNVPASQQTRSIKIKGEGWTTFPTAEQLYFEAEYFNEATGARTTTVQSTAVLSNNTDWFDFSVTFTPMQVGRVVYRAYLKTYAAAVKVYIDNALYRSGTVPLFPIWSEGESHLRVSYKPANSFNVINGCSFIRRVA